MTFAQPSRTAKTRKSLTLLAAALVAALVLPLILMSYLRSAERVRAEHEDYANELLNDAVMTSSNSAFEPPANTWFVDVADQWSDPVGDTWIDPPILGLAEGILNGEPVARYSFDGDWLAVGRWVGDDNVLLIVLDREEEIRSLRFAAGRWLAAGLALPLLGGAVAWAGLGRLREPERAAHAVNREFIADAAHELRTPLSIIQASAGHALARDRDAAEYRESLEEILVATERAGASVGELLEFARLESGQATPRLSPLRLDLLVEEVASSIRVDGVVVTAPAGPVVIVEADYNLIRQVVDNIARNATARATEVKLLTVLAPASNQVRIEVVDNGPGFDVELLDHVFERFRRGDRSGGVGLGMAVAKTIVELHGGTCEAANNADGGAIVSVVLPVAVASSY